MTSRKITVVASELLGRAGTGGAGTADSLLAVALGRHGYRVELLIASGREIGTLSPEWTSRYESAGVSVRVLDRLPGITPSYLAPPYEIYRALRDEPPDVVIADDWRGLGYVALRARQAALALANTAFVIHCHGPGRVLTAFAQKVPDTLERFGESVAERTAIGLADALVSPSAWLLDWMREHGWALPEQTHVIQYPRQSAVLDEIPEHAAAGEPIHRLAFFGQLREGKGIRIFLTALAGLDTELLDGVELIFLGSARGRWLPEQILHALEPEVRERVSDIRFETQLSREDALAELLRPGTLVVVPSLLDNAPNTLSECIEHGIPFVATDTGGIAELVAESDRTRVLCQPEANELAAALTRALASRPAFAPAQPARDARESIDSWVSLVEDVRPALQRHSRGARAVALVATDSDSRRSAERLTQTTKSVETEVVEAESRNAGLFRTRAEWVVFLDDDDNPDDGLIDNLVAAQAASGADVVTVAVRPAGVPDGVHLFLGDPGALGLVENQYGVVGLVRSSLAVAEDVPRGTADPDWPLFVRLALSGAKIVSLPDPFSQHSGKPGNVADIPGEGLAVLELFEQRGADLTDLPQLAATLAAAHARAPSGSVAVPANDGTKHGFVRRVAARMRKELG